MPFSRRQAPACFDLVDCCDLDPEKENQTFGCCDLALDLMTFISELDLDMVVTYLYAKN